MTQHCHLLSGWFAISVQCLLAFACVLTLVIKRHYELPQRDWITWFFDVSKQGCSSTLSHFSNIIMSIIISNSLPNSDECEWYSLTYVSDTTLGTCINFLFLAILDKVIFIYPNLDYLTPGKYGDPPQFYRWLPQVLLWMFMVFVSKLIVLTLLVSLLHPLNYLIKFVYKPLTYYPKFELVVVMIIIPVILNTLQFYVTDTFLKQRGDTDGYMDRQLLNDSSTYSYMDRSTDRSIDGSIHTSTDGSIGVKHERQIEMSMNPNSWYYQYIQVPLNVLTNQSSIINNPMNESFDRKINQKIKRVVYSDIDDEVL